MNDKEILENGYHEYKPTCFHNDGITKCFQKRFDDDIGKKYFIDINKWGDPTDPLMLNTWERDWETQSGIILMPPPIKISGDVNISF